MRNLNFKQLLTVCLLLGFSIVAKAQNDIYWNASTVAPTSSGSNYTVSAITQNNSANAFFINSTSASTSYSFLLNGVATSRSGNDNFGLIANYGALDTTAGGSAFIETILTPASGYKVSISNINFGSRSTTTGPIAYSIQYSVAGSPFTEVATGSFSNNSNWAYKANTVSVAGGVNQNVSIRIFGYGGSGTVSTAVNWRVDDIVITTAASLPVVFGKLQAALLQNVLKVEWATESETNNSRFEIEASTDGKNFTKIGEVVSKAKEGNSSETLQYSFSKNAANATAILGFGLLAIGGLGFKRNRKLIFGLIMLVGTATAYTGCTKNDSAVAKGGNLFIRIAQVNKDGGKSYSKIVKATGE